MSTTKNVALETVAENPANVVTVNPSMGPTDFMSKVRMGTESLFKVTPVAQKSYSKAFSDLGLSTSGNAAIDNAIGALALTLKDDAKNQVRISAMLAYIDGNDLYKRFRDVNGDAFKSMKSFLTSGKMEELTGGESAYSTLQNLLNVGATFYLPYYAGDERYSVFTEISPSKLISLVSLSKQSNYKGFLDAVFSGKKFELVGKTLPEMSVREIQKVASALKPKKQERKTGQSRNGNAATESLNVKTSSETPNETPNETPKADGIPDYVRFDVVTNDGTRKSFYYVGFATEFNDWVNECGILLYMNGKVWAMFLPNADGTHSRAFVAEIVPVKALDNALDLVNTRKAAQMNVMHTAFKDFIKSL